MGADHPQDRKAKEALVKYVESMPEESRGILSHHVNNAMQPIISGIQNGNLKMALKAAQHLRQDLINFGLIVDPIKMRALVEQTKAGRVL